MKFLATVIYTIVLCAISSNNSDAGDLVLQLNVETGTLTSVPNDKQTEHIRKQRQLTSTPTSTSDMEPSESVLLALESTAKEFADTQTIKDANLSTGEWMALYRANIAIESAYNPKAVSPAGAIGLGQLMPNTANQLDIDPHSIMGNLHGSAIYLIRLLKQFGTPDLAIAAYNAGPEAVIKYHGVPPFAETREHVRKVLSEFFKLRKLYTDEQGENTIAKE